MILIAVSWIYILLTSVQFGILTARLFSINITNLPEIAFFSLFSITMAGSFCAFFTGISFGFHIFLLSTSSITFYKLKSFTISVCLDFYNRLCVFPLQLKNLFFVFRSVPVEHDFFTDKKKANQTYEFKAINLLIPSPNARMDYSFEKVTKGNLTFNSPMESNFRCGAGSGKLPCVNKLQLEYFETYYDTTIARKISQRWLLFKNQIRE